MGAVASDGGDGGGAGGREGGLDRCQQIRVGVDAHELSQRLFGSLVVITMAKAACHTN
jgi:hypothetical protein